MLSFMSIEANFFGSGTSIFFAESLFYYDGSVLISNSGFVLFPRLLDKADYLYNIDILLSF